MVYFNRTLQLPVKMFFYIYTSIIQNYIQLVTYTYACYCLLFFVYCILWCPNRINIYYFILSFLINITSIYWRITVYRTIFDRWFCSPKYHFIEVILRSMVYTLSEWGAITFYLEFIWSLFNLIRNWMNLQIGRYVLIFFFSSIYCGGSKVLNRFLRQ